ncbi:MAG: hypothetical protein QOJ91_1734 [Sphingomonadales bacterium]|nr:hypothetical protein [Sphingomonadales bacterium]
MRPGYSFSGSIGLASLAAGPIFLASTALAYAYLELPRPVIIDPAQILPGMALFIPAVFVGFILSIIPNLIGSYLMQFTGGVFPAARARSLWFAAGALAGAAIAGATGAFAQPPSAFALIFTSACCARICRLSGHWE